MMKKWVLLWIYLVTYLIGGNTAAYCKTSSSTLFESAIKAFKSQNYKLAVSKLQEFLKKEPQNPLAPKAVFLLGETYYYMGNYQKAILVLTKAIQNFPLNSEAPRSCLILAKSYVKLGDLYEADQVLASAIQSYPKSPYISEYWYQRGLIAYKQKDYYKAKTFFMKALNNCFKPKLHMEIAFALGDSYVALGNTVAAWDLYQEALRGPSPLDFLKKHPQTYFNLAMVYESRAQLKLALKAYAAAAQFAPQTSLARKALIKAGDIASELKQYKQALTFYCQVIRDFPESDEAIISKFRMADIGAELPNLNPPFESCYEAYRHPWATYQFLAKQPLKELAELAHLRMAQYQIKHNHFQRAIALLKEHISLYPSGKLTSISQDLLQQTVFKYLKRLFKEKKYLNFLSVYLNNASYLSPQTKSKLSGYLAEVYYRLGLYKIALWYYQQLPLNTPIILKLSKCYLNLGYYPDAEHLLETLFEHTYDLNLRCQTSNLLAKIYFEDQKYKKAITKCLYFLNTCTPSNPYHYYLFIAKDFAALNQWDKAQEFLNKIPSQISPTLEKEVKLLLADCYYHQKQWSQAIKLYTEIANRFSNMQDISFIYYRLGQAYRFSNQYSKAVFYYKLLKQDKDTLWQKIGNFNIELINWGKNNASILKEFKEDKR